MISVPYRFSKRRLRFLLRLRPARRSPAASNNPTLPNNPALKPGANCFPLSPPGINLSANLADAYQIPISTAVQTLTLNRASADYDLYVLPSRAGPPDEQEGPVRRFPPSPFTASENNPEIPTSSIPTMPQRPSPADSHLPGPTVFQPVMVIQNRQQATR